MFQQAAEQQAANLLHGVFRREGDGGNKVVLLTATLYLTQEILQIHKQKQTMTAIF